MTESPIITVSLSAERRARLLTILRTLREDDDNVSRSEAVGRAIDAFYFTLCLSVLTDDDQQQPIAA